MSHSIQPVCGAHGSTRNVDGSGSIMQSAAPSHSCDPNAPPAPHTGNTVRCAVSLSSIVVVKPMPFFIAPAASPAVRVLPRSNPCWSANEKRTTVSSPAWMRRSTSRAAVLRSSSHRLAFSARCIAVVPTGATRRGGTFSPRFAAGRREKVPPLRAFGASVGMTGNTAHRLSNQRRARLGGPARVAAAPGVELFPVVLPADRRPHAVDGRGPADLRCTLGVEPHRRLAAFRDLGDGGEQHAAVGDDRLVAGAEMLLRAVLDAALALDRPLVVDVDVEAHAGE